LWLLANGSLVSDGGNASIDVRFNGSLVLGAGSHCGTGGTAVCALGALVVRAGGAVALGRTVDVTKAEDPVLRAPEVHVNTGRNSALGVERVREHMHGNVPAGW